MAATGGRQVCKYCRLQHPDGGHQERCPRAQLDSTEKRRLIAEYTRGYELGYNDSRDENDNFVFPWQVYNYCSPTYQLGYNWGRYDIENEIELAIERNYGEEHDHDDPDILV